MVVHIIGIIIIVFICFRNNPYYILIDICVQDDKTICQWGKKISNDLIQCFVLQVNLFCLIEVKIFLLTTIQIKEMILVVHILV